jgi:hypothetical protein
MSHSRLDLPKRVGGLLPTLPPVAAPLAGCRLEDSPLIPLYYPNLMVAIQSNVDGARDDPTRVYTVRDIRITS